MRKQILVSFHLRPSIVAQNSKRKANWAATHNHFSKWRRTWISSLYRVLLIWYNLSILKVWTWGQHHHFKIRKLDFKSWRSLFKSRISPLSKKARITPQKNNSWAINLMMKHQKLPKPIKSFFTGTKTKMIKIEIKFEKDIAHMCI